MYPLTADARPELSARDRLVFPTAITWNQTGPIEPQGPAGADGVPDPGSAQSSRPGLGAETQAPRRPPAPHSPVGADGIDVSLIPGRSVPNIVDRCSVLRSAL